MKSISITNSFIFSISINQKLVSRAIANACYHLKDNKKLDQKLVSNVTCILFGAINQQTNSDLSPNIYGTCYCCQKASGSYQLYYSFR